MKGIGIDVDKEQKDSTTEETTVVHRFTGDFEAVLTGSSNSDIHLLDAILDIVGALVIVSDVNGSIVRFNRMCETTTNYSFDELQGKCVWESLLRKEDVEPFKVDFAKIVDGQYPLSIENFMLTKNGQQRLITWSNTALLNEDSGQVEYVVLTGLDITERKIAEQRLQYLAHFDSLTDLPNRTLFYDRLSHTLGHSRRYNQMFALLFIDLDGFKHINDTLGHDMGDLLLKQTAKKLPNCVRDTDTVAHVGGDEFVIILPFIKKVQDAAFVAEKIIETLSEPFLLDGHDCFVGASIGISIYPSDGDDIDTLLKNSDIAMYQAKERGRSNYQFFNTEMNSRALRRLKLENNLRKALERNEFVLYYQPKINLTTGKVCAAEALIRWLNPKHGIISPVEFIPLAEETGLIIPIGEWVLRTACKESIAWQRAGYPPIVIAVNLSVKQFRAENLIKTIEDILEETQLSPELLELELTESIVMEDAEKAIKVLRNVRDKGIHVAIDDFGMGYSSLSYLKRFPICRLKIDRSFVRDITTDPDDEAISTAIIAMSHSLKLDVTAEGVETYEQLEFLRALKCDEAQGYLFSQPLPSKEFLEFLDSSVTF
ncbi:MAG: EAL domain-containing protein [Nitrospirae bacterium]|nr:EAL domain-containing protein [Nitrospirota bacterium]MBF0535881.1 EAL domain-containing protein [Nitrospirota bacterium]MBF0617786.1 EAL domain-containing protein [Nitrospirota bacterium]